MIFTDDLQDNISLYKLDLQRLDTLSDSQELWLGIAIDSGRILSDLVEEKDINNRRNCDYLIIRIINKIREINNFILEQSSYKTLPLNESIAELIEEIIEFKSTSKPGKQTIFYEFLDNFPRLFHNRIFDICCYFLLLPLRILEFNKTEIRTKNQIPSIADNLNVMGSLDTIYEIKLDLDLINSARIMLIEGFLSYVCFYAFQYRSRGLDFEDIIQSGNIGLIKAVDKFDVRKENKFKTFGIWWIRQSITRTIDDYSRTIRLPVHLFDKVIKIAKIYKNYRNHNFKEPSIKKMSEITGYEIEELTKLIEFIKPDFSLEEMIYCEKYLQDSNFAIERNLELLPCKDCPYNEDRHIFINDSMIDNLEPIICFDKELVGSVENTINRVEIFLETLVDNEAPSPDETATFNLLKEHLESVMDSLPPREVRILQLRYGFLDGQIYTLEEVGRKIDVTRERVRQIEAQALSRLRHPKIKNKLRDYLGD